MESKWLNKLFKIIESYPKTIVIFWIILTSICGIWSLQLTNYTLFQFTPPNGYDSKTAYDKMEEYFPEKTSVNVELIVFQKTNNNIHHSIINPETQNIYENLKKQLLLHVNPNNNNLIKSITCYYDFQDGNNNNNNTQSMDNLIKHKFVNNNNNMMLALLSIDTSGVSSVKLSSLMEDIEDSLSQHATENIKISITGYTSMFQAFLKTTQSDITGRDLIILPFVFGFMIYVLGSWKLIILPILSLLQSILISFACFLPFAKYQILIVSPLTPTIMFFIIMALSVDYSLFLLSKFASNCRNGQSVNESVKNMIHFSGHVCILSAIILILCYLGLALFPVAGMNSIGYGTAIAILVCASVNITFQSSVLLIFPNFFSDLVMIPHFITNFINRNDNKNEYRLSATNEKDADKADNETDIEMDDDEKQKSESQEFEEDEDTQEIKNEIMECRDNMYFKMAQLVTKSPWNIIIPCILYIIMIPIIIVGFMNYKPALDDTMDFPSKSQPVHTYNTVINNFNPGILNPISVLAINKNSHNHNNDIWSLSYFKHLCNLGETLIDDLDYTSLELMSVTFIPWGVQNDNYHQLLCFENVFTSYKQAVQTGILPPNVTGPFPELTQQVFDDYYMPYFNHAVKDQASIFQIEPTFNGYTEDGIKDAKNLRSLIKSKDRKNKDIELYINNAIYWKLDALSDLYGRIPWALTIIIVVIFSFIGLMYRMVFLPIRLFLCIVIPILFVYGITSLIYIDTGIYWLTPCMTMTVLIGLALDYELFLFSRIYQFRLNGFNNRSSIILGVSLSGPIITSAGIVMSLAFTGLLLQDIVASKQTGTIFVLGVIIDTFIIRPFLVPSLLSITTSHNNDKWNWYPVKMPTQNLKNEYGEIENNDKPDNDECNQPMSVE